jgi:hypothetical protein
MELAARLLRESGFVVLRVGRFGVSIQGEDKDFEQELGVNIQGKEHVVEVPRPRSAELSRLIDLVEIAGPPLNFKNP